MLALSRSIQPVRFYAFAAALRKTMEQYGIVPDVIPKSPKKVVDVSYPLGVNVDMGNILTPSQVKTMPSAKWAGDINTFYTICMTDPDAPSREKPIFREWHHWLVGNIPGTDIFKGETLSEYIGPGPPHESGLHRYVFLIYKQNGKLTFDEKRLSNKRADNRSNFVINKFALKYQLGEPLAVNFYLAEWDDYVPILYKELES